MSWTYTQIASAAWGTNYGGDDRTISVGNEGKHPDFRGFVVNGGIDGLSSAYTIGFQVSPFNTNNGLGAHAWLFLGDPSAWLRAQQLSGKTLQYWKTIMKVPPTDPPTTIRIVSRGSQLYGATYYVYVVRCTNKGPRVSPTLGYGVI